MPTLTPQSVTADRRSLLINGQREIIISGAMHYPRSTPEMWPRLFRESQRAGLNCIETYVFWEGHEPEEGQYDFTGRFNLGHFLDLCQAEGLYAILRIGPYICAEWNFGGLPWWLVTKEGMVTRTENPPFMTAMERFVRVLLDQIGDRQCTQGGPIILAQMENEYNNVSKRYGEAGQRYLQWTGELAHRAGLEVPLVMCEGADPDSIETLNGFTVWERVGHLLNERPFQPALWTENWPGWYDVWGQPHHRRLPAEIAYEVARFIAVGGSGVNYYMWHGGTNFGRDAMYLQTTSYDFTAPLDEYGLPTTKSEHLALLHRFLHEQKITLTEGDRGTPQILLPGEKGDETDSVICYPVTHQQQELAFLVNATYQPQTVTVRTATLELPARSVAVLNAQDTVLYRSWAGPAEPIVRAMVPVEIELGWEMLEEVLPAAWDDSPATTVTLPHNMLVETRDETDFGWYTTTVMSREERFATLTTSVEDFLSVWVNRQYVGSVPTRLIEDRPGRTACAVEITIPLRAGANEVVLLASAMGMIKGDWMIDASQSEEMKGLIAPVQIDGQEVAGPWHFTPGTWGESVKLFAPGPASLAYWDEVTLAGNPLRWYRTECVITDEQLAEDAPWALEIGSLFKGTIWVNGQGIGRYWQQPSLSEAQANPWQHGHVVLEGVGEPPQHYYHIPTAWLRAGTNTIVILEERGALPHGCHLVRRV